MTNHGILKEVFGQRPRRAAYVEGAEVGGQSCATCKRRQCLADVGLPGWLAVLRPGQMG